MRVLFLTNIPSPYRVDFFNELGKLCDLTVTFEGNSSKERDKNWKCDPAKCFKAVYLNGIRTSADKFLSLKILKVLAKDWDAIIIGGYSTPTSIIAIEYLRYHKKDFFIEADGGFIGNDNAVKYWVKKHLIASASGWFTSGKATTEYLVHYGAQLEKCYFYPFTSLNKRDLNSINNLNLMNKNFIRKKLGIKEDKIVLAVGQFIKRKGFDVLIKAAQNLPNDIGIYVVGGKATLEYLQLQSSNDLNNIHFIGFKTKIELNEYFCAADIFVHPTREDIWGLVINEAMAFGLPVITTDHCIAGLELVDAANGAIVPVDDCLALRKSIEEILNGDLEEMKKKSVERISRYTTQNMAIYHMDILMKTCIIMT